jgi:trk system potassium uptake protein TrkH
MDVYRAVKERSIRNVTLHSKVVLSATIILIIFGAVFVFIMEMNNPNTLRDLPALSKILASLFHSVTPRTAGFNTLDTAAMSMPAKFMTIIMMFIGGSPGSTAGGIKTATAAILFLTVVSVVRGKEDPEVFERHIPKYLVYRALSVACISLGLVIFVTMLLSITENIDFMTLFFETTSAFGTVGLSMNYTSQLSNIGRIIISITMFSGRVGPLTIVLALAKRASRNKGNLKYPEDRIMVG